MNNSIDSVKKRTLRDLKVGDTVFVVYQSRRGDKGERRTTHEVITKVGRKYGYFGSDRFERPFCLCTGKSHHSTDCNARANAFGFDVYRHEVDYTKEQRDASELKRLRSRLFDEYQRSGLVALSPDVVEKIHAVLDHAGY